MTNTTATIQNLDYYYIKKKYLFEGLSLTIPTGKICGLLGKNGAGKTTLFKVLSGLTFKKGGTVNVLGFNPGKRQPQFLQGICFLPEEFDTPKLTIKKFIALYSQFYPSFDYEWLRHILKEFELSEDDKLHQLSLGQKKKALIAFTLASRCKILLFDEPTNGLDIPSKSIFRKLVASSLQEHQTILISTHQVRDLDSLIDQVIVLNNGKVIFNEDTESISNRFVFKHTGAKNELEGILYEEDGFHQHAFIAKNVTHEPSKIDFELLFNALIDNPGKFANPNQQSHE